MLLLKILTCHFELLRNFSEHFNRSEFQSRDKKVIEQFLFSTNQDILMSNNKFLVRGTDRSFL